MKDERCECFSNTSECPENDCEGCPARLESEAEIRAKAIEEFAEAVKKAYASMQSISEVERATANTIVMGIEAELKGE